MCITQYFNELNLKKNQGSEQIVLTMLENKMLMKKRHFYKGFGDEIHKIFASITH